MIEEYGVQYHQYFKLTSVISEFQPPCPSCRCRSSVVDSTETTTLSPGLNVPSKLEVGLHPDACSKSRESWFIFHKTTKQIHIQTQPGALFKKKKEFLATMCITASKKELSMQVREP